VPVTPLLETAGNTGGVALMQTDCEGPNEKAGLMIGFTVTVNFTGGTQGVVVLVNV
jgi:hypothetical protein